MAAFVKYNQFAEDFAQKVHDVFGTAGSTADTLKVLLSNTAPDVAAHVVKADAAEIAAGNGYTAGGASATNVGTRSGGTVTITGTTIVFTASGGTIGPFRYAILYNATATSPLNPLIGYWDYGSSITLQAAEFLTVAFGASILTLA